MDKHRGHTAVATLLAIAFTPVLLGSNFGPPFPRGGEPGVATGSISGSLADSKVISSVVAIDRAAGKRWPGKLDADGSSFRVDGLPVDRSYDLIIDAAAARLEGVNMRVPRSDYEEEQRLEPEDIEMITQKVRGLNQFEDVVEILAIDGNIQHAAILLNKVRTRPFYESKSGEVIWRPELWHYERPEETWVKVQDELFVILYRERIQKTVYDKKSVTFDSALGGLTPTAESPAIDIAAIEAPDPKPGIRYRGVGARAPERKK